jgi:hypothetical protein
VARDENADEVCGKYASSPNTKLTSSVKRSAAFKLHERVKMKVEEPGENGGTIKYWKAFTINARRCPVSSWSYKLNNLDGSLHATGAWFPETDLRPA